MHRQPLPRFTVTGFAVDACRGHHALGYAFLTRSMRATMWIVTLRTLREHRVYRTIRPSAGPPQHFLKAWFEHSLGCSSVWIAVCFFDSCSRVVVAPTAAVGWGRSQPMPILGALSRLRQIPWPSAAVAADRRAGHGADDVARVR